MIMARPLRVIIADDNARTRDGLRALLATCSEIEVVGDAADGYAAVERTEACRPDAVLMDLHMPGLDGVAATATIKRRWPAVQIVVLTMYVTERPAALAAGADAVLGKGSDLDRLFAVLGVETTHHAGRR